MTVRTVIQARLCGGPRSTVRKERFALTGWYLDRARAHAAAASSAQLATLPQREVERAGAPVARSDSGVFQHPAEHCFLTILYATLALEAGANELAEDYYVDEALVRFQHARGPEFQRFKGMTPRPSAIVKKWCLLFEKCGLRVTCSEPPLREADALIQVRNYLVHFRIDEAGTHQTWWNRAEPQFGPGGSLEIEVWNAFSPPADEMKSLIERHVNSAASGQHLAAAEAVFSRWDELNR